MAYRLEQEPDGKESIVIDGFQEGIADDPYQGLSDVRNVNIITIPGEASVNFQTYKSSPGSASTTFTANTSNDQLTVTSTTNLGNYSAVTLTTTGTLPAPLATGTTYWLGSQSASTFKIYSSPNISSAIDITTTGTGTHTLTQVTMGKPRYFSSTQFPGLASNQVLLDTNGRAWFHLVPASGRTFSWIYLGNTQFPTIANTQGLGIYTASDLATSYIFVLRDHTIDYLKVNGTPFLGLFGSWVYGWNPDTGGSGANKLNNDSIHEALVGQDNVFYYCDGNYLGSFFENPNQVFDPTTPATYTWARRALALPNNDVAQCLAELGVNLLVGGFKNAIYPWDRISTSFTYPILIADTNIVRMLTVNTNTYIFAGNRGRIYITNGSQAQLYRKVPDHLTGTVEPYYTWGGSTFLKNQIYFSFSTTTNSGTDINTMGGVWAVDLDTKAIRLTNELSYGTYAGLASAIEANLVSSSTVAGGAGLLIGWSDGAGGTGADDTTSPDSTIGSNAYSNGEAYIDSDLIPIGSYLKRKQFSQIEYKLTRPLVSGESISISFRDIFNTPLTGYTTVLTDNTAGNYSGVGPVNFSTVQWAQFRTNLTSTATSPSYVRLKEIRIR